MASILVVTFDSATGIRTGRLIGSTLLEDNAVTSGKIAANAIWTAHITDLAVTSAKLAATLIASIEAGVADGGVTSAKIASGAVGGVHIADAAITSSDIAINTIDTTHILNQGILSASYGANIIAAPHIANQGLLSANYGAAAIAGAHIANQGLTSSTYGAGSVGGTHIADLGITSGKYAAQSITEGVLVSGISIDIAEMNIEPGYRAKAEISGLACVYVANISGNYVDTALAISGYMPAIGITLAAIASGQLGSIIYAGRADAPTSVVSGQYRKQVYVGTSGQLAVTPPSATGNCQQIMGVVKDDDEVMLFPEPSYIEIA